MKRASVVFALMLVVLISGCALFDPPIIIPEHFSTLPEMWKWVSTNISYVEQGNQWWHVQRVYDLRRGDCKGFSVLFAYFAEELGYSARVLTFTANRWVDDGYGGSILVPYKHAAVEINGLVYEPQEYDEYWIVGNPTDSFTVDQINSMGLR